MDALHLQIRVGGEDNSAEEIDGMARQLLAEVGDIDVESAELTSGDKIPEGAKGAGAIELGALVVEVLPAAAGKLFDFLQSWVGRASDRAVKINTQIGDRKIEVEFNPKTVTTEEMGQLVDSITDALTGAN